MVCRRPWTDRCLRTPANQHDESENRPQGVLNEGVAVSEGMLDSASWMGCHTVRSTKGMEGNACKDHLDGEGGASTRGDQCVRMQRRVGRASRMAGKMLYSEGTIRGGMLPRDRGRQPTSILGEYVLSVEKASRNRGEGLP